MSVIKKCKQCGNEFQTKGGSRFCASCSREVPILHGRVEKIVEGSFRSYGRGAYPKDYERLKFGFTLMGGGDE
jgi:hypothetical protein